MSGISTNPGGQVLGRWAHPFELALGGLAALALAFIMLLTCIDVAGRYVMSSPVPGALEVTELVMGALIFTSLPLVTLRNQQVTVDLFDPLIPRAIKPLLHWLIHLIAIACLSVIAWRLWIKAGQMLSGGDTTAVLQIHIWPLVYYMSFQALVTTMVLFLVMVRGGQAESKAES